MTNVWNTYPFFQKWVWYTSISHEFKKNVRGATYLVVKNVLKPLLNNWSKWCPFDHFAWRPFQDWKKWPPQKNQTIFEMIKKQRSIYRKTVISKKKTDVFNFVNKCHEKLKNTHPMSIQHISRSLPMITSFFSLSPPKRKKPTQKTSLDLFKNIYLHF